MKTKYYLYGFFLLSLSALLYAASLPNFYFEKGIPGIGFFCLVPFFLVLFFVPTIRHAYYSITIWSSLYILFTFYWLKNFREYAAFTFFSVLILFSLLYTPILAVMKSIMNTKKNAYRPFLLSFAWLAFEYIRSRGYLGFPWGLLSQTVHQSLSFIQIAQIGGEWLVNLFVVYGNVVLFEALLYYLQKNPAALKLCASNSLNTATPTIRVLDKTRQQSAQALSFHLVFLFVIYAGSVSFGFYSLQNESKLPAQHTVHTLTIQQNFDSWQQTSPERTLEKLTSLTNKFLETPEVKAADLDMILWSETSLLFPYQPKEIGQSYVFYNTNPKDESFFSFLNRIQTPLLTGVPFLNRQETNVYYNAASLIDADGNILGSYSKNQLVPMAEYSPLQSIAFFSDLLKSLNIYSPWTPGGSIHPIELPIQRDGQVEKIKLGLIICFEDAFSFISREHAQKGAHLLVNLSNVSWASTPVSQEQQLVTSKFRAIETGLPLIRSTNSGISSLVDPWGRVVQSAPIFQEAMLLSSIPLQKNNTLFLVIGDSIALFCLVAFLLTALLLYYEQRRASKP